MNKEGQQGAQENQSNQESSESSLKQPGGRHSASSVASLPRNVLEEARSDEVTPSRSDKLSQKKRAAVRRQALDNDSVAAALGEDDEVQESSEGLRGGRCPNQASSSSTGTPSLDNELAEKKRFAVRRQVLDGPSASNAPMVEEEEEGVVEAPVLTVSSPYREIRPGAYPVSPSGNAVRQSDSESDDPDSYDDSMQDEQDPLGKDAFVFHAERVDVAMNRFVQAKVLMQDIVTEQGSPVQLDGELGETVQRRRGQKIVAAGVLGLMVAAISIGILVSKKGKSEPPVVVPKTVRPSVSFSLSPSVSLAPSLAPSAGPCVVNDPVPGDVSFSGEVEEYLEIGQSRYGSPIGRWCVRNVPDFAYAFYGQSTFNEPLNLWDVSSATQMQEMFASAWSFNQDLSSWDVSRVETMSYMFYSARSFNQDLSSWDVSRVETMSSMFYVAPSFNQDLSSWNVSRVETMHGMFRSASSFNQDLSTWDVSRVERMDYMFRSALSFDQDLSTWNVSRVAIIDSMFNNASSFNQDLSLWDVSKVISFRYLFYEASSFRQDLCAWGDRIQSDSNVYFMFRGTDCPEQGDPDLTAIPVSPLCFACT